MSKPKICFCALNAYPLLAKSNFEFIGGAELQQVLIAKELAKNGYDVSFVVFDEGQKPLELVDGISIYTSVKRGYSLTGPKTIYSAIKKIWNAMEKADGDIYFQRCASYFTGFVALFCLLKGKKFVFQMAHDSDADGSFIKNSHLYAKALYYFGIKRANIVTAQNTFQQQLLKKTYGRNSELIKNICFTEKIDKSSSKTLTVLWAGTIKKEKQPELFLELAKALPEAKFQMIGASPKNIGAYYENFQEMAKKIKNLEMVGFVPYHLINQYFIKSSVFVNTSTLEGFPNTFLQAWMTYTPVISLNVDPDEVICKNNSGFHSKTFNQMVNDTKLLLNEETLRNQLGLNGRMYLEAEHDSNKIIQKYMKIFDNLIK